MDPYTNVVCPDCGHHTRVKCELDHYLLTTRYAVGGMSVVFSARDTTLERDVAIKLLNEEYSKDAKRMEEFEREAKITAALSHPHIVRVFTVGQAYGHYYIAMELVTGENLEQKISHGGALREDEVLPIAMEIISGLRAANSAGLIHRDMKPGNVLFDDAGNVKIVDFGLALVTMGGSAKADEIWATPYYVPPEALDGREEDFRSDIYALGATLYHALSGKAPLPESAKSTREVRKAKEHIEPLAQVAPWLHPATCYLVDKAMALKPEERFSSYDEMEDAWRAASQALLGGAEEPIHSEERRRRRVRDTKGLAGVLVAGVVALVLLGAAVALFIQGQQAEDEGAPVGGTATELTQDGLMDQGGDADPEVSARIGRLFVSGHSLLKRGKYAEAQRKFMQLSRDPGVREPMASWSRVEILISAWLDGNASSVEEALKRLRKHSEGWGSEGDPSMVRLIGLLSSPETIADQAVGDGPMAVVEVMALALKNWELGAWEQAVPMFEAVMRHSLPEGSGLTVYQDLARLYLDDYQLLESTRQMETGTSVEELEAELKGLNKKLSQLKTQGRAKFHVRVWQVRLHHQIKEVKRLARQESGGQNDQSATVTLERVRRDFLALSRQARFAEASELMQSASATPAEKGLKGVWLHMADSSNMLLGMLEDGIPSEGVGVEIKLKAEEGEPQVYSRVISSKPGSLQLQKGGEKVFVAWSQIAPESVIDLFKMVVKPSLNTAEGQMQTELAICFSWLTGMEDKARQVASRLSEANQGFETRWERSMGILDANQ